MIVKATLAHLLSICHALDLEQRAEHAALSWTGQYDPDEVADRLYRSMGVGVALIDGVGMPQAAGGITWSRPGVATTWMIGTDRMRQHIRELTRAGRQIIDAALAHEHIMRVECWAASWHIKAHRWYRLLGLTEESESAGYASGQAFKCFVRVKQGVEPCA